MAGALLGAAALLGCGYRPTYAAGNVEPLCVVAERPRAAEWDAVDAALRGARSELARAGALASGTQYPCLKVQVLRLLEGPSGIRVAETSTGEQPLARGTVVSATGRGWVERFRQGPVSRDTGDMTRSSRGAVSESEVVDATRHRRLVQAASYALGAALARRVLGLPEPSRDVYP